MLVFDVEDADYQHVAPIGFDPSLPPPPPATAKITPATKLPYYARVAMSGKNWAPNDFVFALRMRRRHLGVVHRGRLRADGWCRQFPPATRCLGREITDPFGEVAPRRLRGEARPLCRPRRRHRRERSGRSRELRPEGPDPSGPVDHHEAIRPVPEQSADRVERQALRPEGAYSVGECVFAGHRGRLQRFGETVPVTNAAGSFTTVTQVQRKLRASTAGSSTAPMPA